MSPSALLADGDSLPDRPINSSQYTVTETPLGTPRQIRVLMVGAGASGINLARHMDLHMTNFDLQIYEKNAGVGGTWYENRSVTTKGTAQNTLTLTGD